MNNSNSKQHFEYYVALDLGSESMSAYFRKVNSPEGAMIDLLERADKICGTNAVDERIEQQDGQSSKRMRTQISLENGRQPKPLPIDHARLNLVGQQDQCLFTYFHRKNAQRGELLPNLKIPFQFGSEGIVPEINDSNSRPVRHSPEQLLQHATLQIVENLILKSSVLESVTRAQIHLTLTVPNVYSLTHAESIRQFVQDNLMPPVGKVEFLYESDALAYAVLAVHAQDQPEVVRFYERIHQRKDRNRLRLATIDVGRGTTDLSLIELQVKPEGERTGEHYVLARTGNCEAGNGLTWIFVAHYNEILRHEFAGESRLTYNFTTGDRKWAADQANTNRKLFDFVEKMKRSMGPDFEIGMTADEQEQELTEIVQEILNTFDKSWDSDASLVERQEKAIRQMILPAVLPQHRKFFHRDNSSNPAVKLRMRIEKYIEGIVTLIGQLREVAAARETDADNHTTRVLEKHIFDSRCTFAVVAGQASHFAPLAKALMAELRRFLPPEQICFLQGVLAKEACARGAVSFQTSLNERMNQEELFGTYAFMAPVPFTKEDWFVPINMRELKSEGSVTLTGLRKTPFWLVYSPRVKLSATNPPKFFDGTTAMLCVQEPDAGTFNVEYTPATRQMTVNTHPVSLATFGSVNEAIYPKLWPEVLEPRKEK